MSEQNRYATDWQRTNEGLQARVRELEERLQAADRVIATGQYEALTALRELVEKVISITGEEGPIEPGIRSRLRAATDEARSLYPIEESK